MINAARNAARNDMNTTIDTKIKGWINTYFIGKYLVFIKSDSTKVSGLLTKMEPVNATGDTYVLRVVKSKKKQSTIPLDDIINNMYTAIVITDVDAPSKDGPSILKSPTLRGILRPVEESTG